MRNIIITAVALAVLAAGLFTWFFMAGLAAPINVNLESAEFTVAPGASFAQIYGRLKERRLLERPWMFYMLVKLRNAEKKIQAGEYEIFGSEDYRRLLKRFTKGEVRRYRVTIPEGSNLTQVAAAVREAGFTSQADQFLLLAADPKFVNQCGLKADTLEGYMFPDTYYFPKGTAARVIVNAMLKRFREVYGPSFFQRAVEIGMTDYQVLTLASIIQKEAADPAEMPLISAVFHNRLKKGIRLQSDPTVIYGMHDFNGNLRRRDLQEPTPYNTYTRRGLPPGPIANPGLDAIKAALYPAAVDYIYFVSRNDGTHEFSSSLSDHNRAVEKYQKSRPLKSRRLKTE